MQTKIQLDVCWDPIFLWNIYARYANLSNDLTEDIAQELASSLRWQEYSYQHPPTAPTFNSPSIEWEQSIVEGHPTHPMHKLRSFLSPMPDYAPGTYDLYHPKLRFLSIPKTQLKITNDFEKYMKPVIEAAARHAGTRLVVPANHVIIPVHELQTMHIQHKFPDIEILPAEFVVPVLAQQSIRSVQVPDAYVDLSLKLGVGLKLTSTIRTISPASAYLGPRFSAQVVPHLNLDPNVVTVAKELASVVHAHSDVEIAKHCSAIIREAHENTSEQRGERLIVCTALVESGHLGEEGHLPAVVRIFQLNTEEKRLRWLDRYVQVFFQAFLPSVMYNGVAFECHPQNCLARFDMKTKELRGFVIRDFGGLRVHPETLYATTGVKLDCLPGHSIVAPDMDDVYTRMYHTVIHNHLQQLIRVLGLHYNGQGWKIVRKHLMIVIPKEHGLYTAWLSPERKTLPSKCFLRMRMAGMYRFHLHSPVPNLIFCDKAFKLSFTPMTIEDVSLAQRKASFAVVSRLLSCLVTERLLKAFYITLDDNLENSTGIVIILSTHLASEQIVDGTLYASDIFAVVPVHHPPVLLKTPPSKHGRSVGLLDPLDMLPEVYELRKGKPGHAASRFQTTIINALVAPAWELDCSTSLTPCVDPVLLWTKFAPDIAPSENETIKKEFRSSFEWQSIAYENPPRCPSWDSGRIEWEQSLVAGHPTHPMHRARMLPFKTANYDWYHPRIRFAAIPRSSLDILGPFELTIHPIASKAAAKLGINLPDDNIFAIIPVHELQADNVTARVPEVEMLHPDISIEAFAQSSIRTLSITDLPDLAIKLSVGVRISSALRTISHFTTNFGPRFSEIISKLKFDREFLIVEKEPASAVYRSVEPDISKHLAVVLRDQYQSRPNERVIICAALLEMDHLGSPPGVAAIQHILQLDSQAKRIEFLDQYIRIACHALLPPLIYNGVAFEAHAQNILVRFDRESKAILGFVVRDLGGLRIHPPTLRQSTDVDFQFLPGHCIAAKTLEEAFSKFYHTFVHNHIQRLIRVLDLHYNGIGWMQLRRHMRDVIPHGHALEKAWLDPSITEVQSKCLMRMRMLGSYREASA
ncbi:hypothetical protein APHAL10511_007457 [Amanita phalloides]|nr:hypothetical protein APHAL10511_007457 [Amanita phalloides]